MNRTKIILVVVSLLIASVAVYFVYTDLTKPLFRLYNTFWSDNVNLYIYEVQYSPPVLTGQPISNLEVFLDEPASFDPFENKTESYFQDVQPNSVFVIKSPIKEVTIRFRWEGREEEYTFEIKE